MSIHTHTAKISGILKELWRKKASFFVIFVKKDGTTRLMWAQYGVKHNLKGGVNYTQQSHFPYSTVWDKTKKEYRTINMATALAIVTEEGNEYIFKEELEKAVPVLVPLSQS